MKWLVLRGVWIERGPKVEQPLGPRASKDCLPDEHATVEVSNSIEGKQFGRGGSFRLFTEIRSGVMMRAVLAVLLIAVAASGFAAEPVRVTSLLYPWRQQAQELTWRKFHGPVSLCATTYKIQSIPVRPPPVKRRKPASEGRRPAEESWDASAALLWIQG